MDGVQGTSSKLLGELDHAEYVPDSAPASIYAGQSALVGGL